MNETLENIKNRRSIKKFKPDTVPEEFIEQIVEAGMWAPSRKNKQSAIIIAITNKQKRDALAQENAKILNTNIDPFYGAPVVLLVLADKTVNTYLYDGSVVLENMLLAAHSLGLGSCWIHRAKEELETEFGKKLRKELNIPDTYEGIGHCVIGYADITPQPSDRKEHYVYYVK